MPYRFAVPSRRLGAELDQLFDAVFPDRATSPAPATTGWTAATSLVEAADRFVVTLDLPGVPTNQVQVVAEQGRLVVKGERPAAELTGTTHLAERRVGPFARTFRLPESVDPTRIDASHAHGVLTITLPKREPAIARAIEIRGA